MSHSTMLNKCAMLGENMSTVSWLSNSSLRTGHLQHSLVCHTTTADVAVSMQYYKKSETRVFASMFSCRQKFVLIHSFLSVIHPFTSCCTPLFSQQKPLRKRPLSKFNVKLWENQDPRTFNGDIHGYKTRKR